jgi:hypothetical protein
MLYKQKQELKLSRTHYAGAKGDRSYSFYLLLTSAIDGVSGQHYVPAVLYQREKKDIIHGIRDWVGQKADLGTEARGKIGCLCRGSNTGRPVCSQTVY